MILSQSNFSLLFCDCSDIFLHELHSDAVDDEEKKHMFQTTTVNLTLETVSKPKEDTSKYSWNISN